MVPADRWKYSHCSRATCRPALLVVDDEHIERMLVAPAATPLGFTRRCRRQSRRSCGIPATRVRCRVLDLALGETESISLLPALCPGEPTPCDFRFRHGTTGCAPRAPGWRAHSACAWQAPWPKPVAPAALRALSGRIPDAPHRQVHADAPPAGESELALAPLPKASWPPRSSQKSRCAPAAVKGWRRWPAGTVSTARFCCDLFMFIPLAEAAA